MQPQMVRYVTQQLADKVTLDATDPETPVSQLHRQLRDQVRYSALSSTKFGLAAGAASAAAAGHAPVGGLATGVGFAAAVVARLRPLRGLAAACALTGA